MASVNEYIKKLLYQYDCVVVPEFGAFLTNYQPAVFTETSGLFLPPRKRVAFNEALRFDDGILANYIMLHEPVTREGAQRHISQFVDKLRQQLEGIGQFELDGIGTFNLNNEGKLQFDPSLRHNFFGEAYGMSALSVQLVNSPAIAEKSIEAIPVTTPGPALVRDEDAVLTPLNPTLPYWRVAAAIVLVGSIGLVSYFSVIKPGQPQQSSLNPANLLRTPAFANHSTASKEISKKVAINPSSTLTPVATAKATVIPTSVEGNSHKLAPLPSEIKTLPVAITVTKPVATIPIAVTPKGRHYTVIAGAFSKKQAALPLVEYLHKAGYPDAYVMVQGRRSFRYKVAAVGSGDILKVQSLVPVISQLSGSKAWIYTN